MRYWMAATANNALYEFDDYAALDGILPPPHNLPMLNTSRRTAFSAPMFDKLGNTATWQLMPDWAQWLAPTLFPAITFSVIDNAPDVFYGYEDMNSYESDQVKNIWYHEYAHASHMNLAGGNYWQDLAQAEIDAGGWGTWDGPDADIISITESWADFIANTYSHRTYDGNTSLGAGNTWENEIEETRNLRFNFIPAGLHHDLVDNLVDPLWRVNDNVEGFSIQQLYSTLDGNTRSIPIYRQKVNTFLPLTGDTQQEFNNLFDSY